MAEYPTVKLRWDPKPDQDRRYFARVRFDRPLTQDELDELRAFVDKLNAAEPAPPLTVNSSSSGEFL